MTSEALERARALLRESEEEYATLPGDEELAYKIGCGMDAAITRTQMRGLKRALETLIDAKRWTVKILEERYVRESMERSGPRPTAPDVGTDADQRDRRDAEADA